MVDESPLTVAQEMANVIFNLSHAEDQKLIAAECRQLKRLYDRWNIASAPRNAPAEVHAHAPEPSPWREEVWMRAWCAVSSAFNCKTAEAATRWADKALEAFDARFPPK
jgi:hypothetical protein